ncbi:hypothetical protein [Oscillatoria acuminata]|uniref:hypothetical protein n=1 Tax=Oscillatoria acuminata TaxID=118323 RepID=UPI0002F6555F|nr:hypothetical protein [Oscillatoria acuminata]
MIVAKIGSSLHRSGPEPSPPSESPVPVTGKLDSTPSGDAWDTFSPCCTLQAIGTHP